MRYGLKFFNLYGHILMLEPLKCAYRMAWANDGGRAKAFQSDYAYDKRRDSPEWNTDRMVRQVKRDSNLRNERSSH